MDKDSLRSPIIPQTPAPAYTPLPHSFNTYHSAPLLNGEMGDIELETVDGKRFLVHKSILEAETVFFHIYYGFVPVWRLNGTAPAPYHTSAQSISQPTSQQGQQGLNLPINLNANFGGLASLRKIITSTLAPVSGPSSSFSQSNSPAPPPPFSASGAVPPPPANLGPKLDGPVTAPTPTASPFTWLVPESSTILSAFLTLIYPCGTITPTLMNTIDITGRVIRATLGYQSTKALTLARDHLSHNAWLEEKPLEVYSMACFFKFSDLAKLSSQFAVKRPIEEWAEYRGMMGRTGMEKLHELWNIRMEGLHRILDRSLMFGGASEASIAGEGAHVCEDVGRMRQMWAIRVDTLRSNLGAGSELLELLEVDLRGGWCEGCLVALGRNIQGCIVQARSLPQSI